MDSGENLPPGTDADTKADPHDLIINVLGASFSITVGEDPKYLEEVLEQYNLAVASTQAISGMKDPLKVAILTGFLMCDEFNKLKLHMAEEQMAITKSLSNTQSLIFHLEKVIDTSQPNPDDA